MSIHSNHWPLGGIKNFQRVHHGATSVLQTWLTFFPFAKSQNRNKIIKLWLFGDHHGGCDWFRIHRTCEALFHDLSMLFLVRKKVQLAEKDIFARHKGSSYHFFTSLYGAVQYSGVTWRTKPSFDEFMMMESNLVFNRIQPVSLWAAIVSAWINFNCSRMFACRLWFMKWKRLTIIRWPKWKQRWNGTPLGLIVCNEVV